ncbi:MAG: hypothetical protein IT371_21760 [Deltaproteobacteria bacterium]|nr:hypothetical protein [Deltaproteobacteria bacterium]
MTRWLAPVALLTLVSSAALARGGAPGPERQELSDGVARSVYWDRTPTTVEYRRRVGGLGALFGRGTLVTGFLQDDPRMFYLDPSQSTPSTQLRTRFTSQAYGHTTGSSWDNLAAHAVRVVTFNLEPAGFKKEATPRWQAIRRRAAELVKQSPEELVLAAGWIQRGADQIFKGELSVMNFRTIFCEKVETELVRKDGQLVFRARPYYQSKSWFGDVAAQVGWGPWVTIATYKPGRAAKEVFLPAALERMFAELHPKLAEGLPAAK